MALHDPIAADTRDQTLDYAERLCHQFDFLRFHYETTDRKIDFRAVAAKLLDLGAPIADWRNDPRVFDVRLPDALPVYYESTRSRDDTARYGGEAAETLRGIRREYEKPLIDWLFADKPPVAARSDEGRVCVWLIQHMPSVEEFVDEGFPVMGRAAA